jgi:hypothetical protein
LKAQEQVRAKGARRAITLLVIVVLGIVAGVFFGQFYFVHELVLFVSIATIVAFFAVHLMVLGILFHLTGQSIFHSVRKAKPVAAREKANAERQAGPFLGSPTVQASAANSAGRNFKPTARRGRVSSTL